MIRTSTFDTIYVIESLFDNDKKTGTILYNDIIRWFPDKFKYVKAELVVIDNRNLFFSELEKVKVNSKKTTHILICILKFMVLRRDLNCLRVRL